MQADEWADLNVGDYLKNNITGECYVVSDATMIEEKIYALTRTVIGQNPQEWERVRKTVAL